MQQIFGRVIADLLSLAPAKLRGMTEVLTSPNQSTSPGKLGNRYTQHQLR